MRRPSSCVRYKPYPTNNATPMACRLRGTACNKGRIATVAILPLLQAVPRKRQAIGVALLVGYGLYLTQLLGRRIHEGL